MHGNSLSMGPFYALDLCMHGNSLSMGPLYALDFGMHENSLSMGPLHAWDRMLRGDRNVHGTFTRVTRTCTYTMGHKDMNGNSSRLPNCV
eukprot:1157442-Pelagomonas_calceolata.AAC.6